MVCIALLSIVSYTMHSSLRPTDLLSSAFLMLRRVKLWCKLPIWPILLKLWMSLYLVSLLGPFPLLYSQRSQKVETVYLHMNWCDTFASIDQMAQVLPLVLFINEKLFSLCQYKGRNQCIEGGDMTQTEAVWNKTTVGRWLMLMWPLDKRSIPHAARTNISALDKISCGIYKIRCTLTK